MKSIAAIVFIQALYAVMSIVAKAAMSKGLSPYVLVTYRMVVATCILGPLAFFMERNKRPPVRLAIFAKICLLSLFEPVLDQNLYYTGMKYTTATFTAAACNILPALTFVMACVLRVEKVNLRNRRGQAKVLGTLICVAGAMLMSLLKGPGFHLSEKHRSSTMTVAHEHGMIKGILMIVGGCFSWASFIILQAHVLKKYPAALSLTAMMCMLGMVQSAILALVIERGNFPSAWLMRFDIKLLASVYGGVVSGVAFYIMGWVASQKGPVFVSSFNPLNLIIIALASFFFLKEEMYTGRIIGALVIVMGLYIVLWGKRADPPPAQQVQGNNIEMPTTTGDVEV